MGAPGGNGRDDSTGDADTALVELYSMHNRSLVGLAAVLLRDASSAEDVVQDAFVAMHAAWPRLRDPDSAAAYLRQSVVNRSRSRLRHLAMAVRKAPAPLPDTASPEYAAMHSLEQAAVMRALRGLPRRQREVLVLRYYSDLSEAQIAATLGISTGAVKSHAARGIATLRQSLESVA